MQFAFIQERQHQRPKRKQQECHSEALLVDELHLSI